MAYIGRDISNLSDRVVLDNITASATATYNLLLNSVAFVPSSAESLTVSLNGVIQKPQSSYTVSGSTIVFASALTSSDSIDFILAERAITLTTIGSGTVNTSNIVDDAVTYAKTDGSFGKIGQVVTTNFTSNQTTTSTSFSDSGVSASITPTSTSSKVLIQMSIYCQIENASNDHAEGEYKIYRDSSSLDGTGRRFGGKAERGADNEVIYKGYQTWILLDSPSSTSSVSYKIYFRSVNNTNETTFFGYNPCSITLMEVLP